MNITNTFVVGKNSQYEFAVGQVGERWIGFAKAGGNIFVFSQISAKGHFGILDRDRAILLTGAIAEDQESAYGGVEEWFIPVELRGECETMRCRDCDTIGCDGNCDDDGSSFDDFDDDDGSSFDDFDDGDPEEFLDVGLCCACEKPITGMVNIMMLHKKNPEPGSGWGCLQCDLPSDGASAVVCDACRESKATLKFATVGYLRDKKRVPIESLVGTHDHDLSKHPELQTKKTT